MLKKVVCALVAASSFGVLLFGADYAFVGTWKLNVAKSKFTKGRELKDATVVVTVEGDIASVTINDTGDDGQAFTIKYTVPTAGGPITYSEAPPGPGGTTDVLKKIDARTDEMTATMNGKVIWRRYIVVSPDHKTLTVRESGVAENGHPVKGLYVYDKQ